jgi:hypothetical protein
MWPTASLNLARLLLKIRYDLIASKPTSPYRQANEPCQASIPAEGPGYSTAHDTNDESQTLVPNKVHVRGLDTLTTTDIKGYVAEYYGAADKIEWIDDTSANIVFSSETLAQEALIALSVMDIADATQLPVLESLPAKPMSSKPEVNLQIRFAVQADKKQSGAAARSRFYLLHPEYDPEERRRREQTNRGRYRDRDGDNYRNRRSGAGRYERREDQDVETFDASLYDDDEATVAARDAKQRQLRRYSGSDDSGEIDETTDSRVNRNQSKELFPSRRNRGRGRSASPLRDRDGDEIMDGPDRTASSHNNKSSAMSIKANLRGNNSNKSKELFPSKLGSSQKGRIDQLDIADEATVLMDRSLGFPLEEADQGRGTQMPLSNANVTPSGTGTETGGFNIRGLAQQKTDATGFAIKGAASKSVKELFPDKFGGNVGKELFAEKLEGRGRRRQRAEDLFQ